MAPNHLPMPFNWWASILISIYTYEISWYIYSVTEESKQGVFRDDEGKKMKDAREREIVGMI